MITKALIEGTVIKTDHDFMKKLRLAKPPEKLLKVNP